MEAALLVLADKAGKPHDILRAEWTRDAVLPFDAAHRYMATQATLDRDASDAFIHVKGAPEAVFDLCAAQAANGGEGPLDQAYWEAETERIAGLGQRVIALATKPASQASARLEHLDLSEGLVLLGLVGLIDPPRAETIADCRGCRLQGCRDRRQDDHRGPCRDRRRHRRQDRAAQPRSCCYRAGHRRVRRRDAVARGGRDQRVRADHAGAQAASGFCIAGPWAHRCDDWRRGQRHARAQARRRRCGHGHDRV